MGFSLKEKKKELLAVKHPLHREDASVKIPYLVAIAILMARVDDHFADAERESLTELAYTLDLPEGQLDRLLVKALEADQHILDEILPSLQTQDVRHAFVLDLYKAAHADGAFKEEEREFINDVVEMMQFPAEEAAFLHSFAAAACGTDLKAANSAVQKAIEAKLEPDIALLRYFLPGFTYEEELAGFTLAAHETRIINRSAKLVDAVTVGFSAKLIVRDCTLSFQGAAQIIIDGGEVEFVNATFVAVSDYNGYLICANESTPLFAATGCTFDGGGRKRLVVTCAVKTIFTNCTFTNAYLAGNAIASPKWENARIGAAISSKHLLILNGCTFTDNFVETAAGAVFAGGPLQMTDTVFRRCRSKGIAGALLLADRYDISGCTFEECGSEECGGAVYITGGDEKSKLKTSAFTKCKATKSGGAVYIHDVKYALSQCAFHACSAGVAGGGMATDKYDQKSSLVNKCMFTECAAIRGGGISLTCRNSLAYLPDSRVTKYIDCLPDDYKVTDHADYNTEAQRANLVKIFCDLLRTIAKN